MVQAGDLLDSRYQLDSVMIEDKRAMIWRAYDRHMERYVAIKILNYTEQVTRIHHEALTSGELEHPHLVPIYDYSIKSKPPYLVMRLISNQHLWDILEQEQLETREILRLAQQVGDALDYLHQKKIVHGDFKSTNILIDAQRQAYLTNFSISLRTDEQGKAVNMGRGSFAFLAPEQLSEAKIDYRIDLYALGITLYQCFANHLPFNEKRGMEGSLAARQQINPDVGLPSVRDSRPELPIGVDLVLDRLTRRDLNERYSSATEAINHLLQAFYSGQGMSEGKVFISYARKDSEYVYTLAKELQRLNIDIWIDQDIEHGKDWGDSIENALNDCDMMLLIATKDSMASDYVTHEWSYFMGGGKPVYPFISESSAPDNIHPRLNRVQHIIGTDDMLNNIARIVDVLAGGNPTKLGNI